MRKTFGPKPSPGAPKVTVGRGPMPPVEPRQPGAFVRGAAVRRSAGPRGAMLLVRWGLILLIAGACVLAMWLAIAWLQSR